MKILTFFLVATLVQAHAASYGQHVSLNFKNAPLADVLDDIQKQTGYELLYNSRVIGESKKTVSINVKKVHFIQALKTILADRRLDFEVNKNAVLIREINGVSKNQHQPSGSSSTAKREQQRTITGKVVDANNNPISGVTVLVKGTTVGTSTDNEGSFSLNVPQNGSTLVFSVVGHKEQEVLIGDQRVLNVVLESNIDNLDEVVVVGYSSQKMRYLSSSISNISAEKLKDVTANDLSTMLQGKAPGVVVSTASGDPSSEPRVLIRGAGTISASTAPLVVVDGNIGGSYNPADIESVSILKDVAATGLYGSRAANGVIIVNTKMGRPGKTKVEFNNSFGFANPTTGNFRMMNSQELYDFQKTFYNRDPSVVDNNTNWWDLAFGTGYVNNHNLSVSGGSEKVQYYTSGVFYREEGTLKGTGHTGYNFRNNLIANITDRLKASVFINGKVNKNTVENSNTMYDAYINLPFDPAFDANGEPIDARFHPNWLGREKENFLHSLLYNYNRNNNWQVSGDLNLDYKLSSKVLLSSYNRTQLQNGKSARYFDRRTKQGGANIGELYNDANNSSRFLTSNRIRYAEDFGRNSLVLLGVAEVETTISESSEVSGKGLPAGRDVMSVATDILQSPKGAREQVGFRKYLAQADYSFDNRYFLIGSFVNEFSSKFGRNNSTANFYQLGASWILTNEGFLKESQALSFAKLRASYGTVGNADGISNFASLGLYSITQEASYTGLPGAAPYQKGNPNLSWEKIKSANIGADVTLWNKVAISVDVYEKKASELLYRKPLAATTGYSYVWVNAGSVRNRGIEFNITSQNITKENFSWETGFNMAFNRNKVLELSDGSAVFNAGARQPIAVGYDMDAFSFPIWVGVDPANGDPLWEKVTVDAEGNKTITTTNKYSEAASSTSRQFTGTSAAPKFTGGLSNTLKYKDFSLSAFFNFVYGNEVYNETRVSFDNDGLYEAFNSMVLKEGWTRWEKAGDIATHPKPIVGGNKESNQSSSRYLEDGSYIRLRNLRLGYNLPQHLLTRMGIARVHLFVSADNLWTATKFSGPDPEVSLSQVDQVSGVSNFKYPISKKILFGLNLTL
ncbi:SusC/RagA family TonB-linked outer membrane protein [Sphingobacterium psychroaquaticum]|uniref:SusC/RagA family TonB-linked outer membrane protein n=1 Tax=Sphingobacterium psychroaquaticum TaxID=561061 RepID=UPI00141B95EA|nr:SusC/RagA family TonB-linked outer membrane protein [Sphingobacterium psychroaquaticum]